MAEPYELHQGCERQHSDIDGLVESDLDRVSLIEEEPLCSSMEEYEPTLEHSSTWPVKPATKQDGNRSSFLDLPVEIRVAIYEFYCLSVLKDLRRNHMPANMDDICKGIPARSLEPRLFCHQIRSEFTPVWARCQTFLLSAPWAYHARDLDSIWLHIRDFFEWMGPAAKHHVRTIRVCHIWSVDFPRSDPYDWRPYTPGLHASTADSIIPGLEPLTDVPEDLKIEVEIRYLAFHDAPNFRALRRIFTMRQRSFGPQQPPGWICDVGDVQTTEIERNIHKVTPLLRSLGSPYCIDEVWKLEEDANQEEES